MAVSFVIADTLVSEEELSERHARGAIAPFQKALRDHRPATLEFSTGAVSTEDLAPTPTPRGLAPSAPEFTPIGIGKPLSIEILTVYTGDTPSSGLFGRSKPDLLVASGVIGLCPPMHLKPREPSRSALRRMS